MKSSIFSRFCTPPRNVARPDEPSSVQVPSPPRTPEVKPAGSLAPSSEGRAGAMRRSLHASHESRTHSLGRTVPFSIPTLERRDSGDPNLHPDHYMKLPSGYVSSVDGEMVEPTLYQPTPTGLDVLTQFYSERSGCDLRHFPQQDLCEDKIPDRFRHFASEVATYELKDGKAIGVVLSYGQRHSVPVMLEQRAGKKYLLIFDSTSGPITKQYYHVANTFSDFQVMLNKGTRQVDKQSCITDAVEVLRTALRTQGTLDAVLEKAELQTNKEPQPGGRPRLLKPIKLEQDNFHLFALPEALCFTAQAKGFIKNTARADVDKTIKRGESSTSLGRELTKHTQISYRKNSTNSVSADYFKMNAYLYDASRTHKQIIDQHLELEKEHE